jgi:hypothetical protein
VYTVRNRDRRSILATQVTIAGTSQERRMGLKGRAAALPSDAGLWIAPCEAIHTFGMRVAIDAVFLDRDFRVRKIRSGIPPRKFAFCMRAYSVLELAAGRTAESSTRTGDQLEFRKNGEAQ